MHGLLAVSKYFLTKMKKEEEITELPKYERKNCYMGLMIYLIAMKFTKSDYFDIIFN